MREKAERAERAAPANLPGRAFSECEAKGHMEAERERRRVLVNGAD